MEILCVVFVFFFKQKTAYEMRISDWSSDVCSSDLAGAAAPQESVPASPQGNQAQPATSGDAVASIVDTEFPAYDQNHDGQLDKAEFSRWMVALKDQELKATRSEEHTSELQSLMRISYAVFCL